MATGMRYDVTMWDLGSRPFLEDGLGYWHDSVASILSPMEHVKKLKDEVGLP